MNHVELNILQRIENRVTACDNVACNSLIMLTILSDSRSIENRFMYVGKQVMYRKKSQQPASSIVQYDYFQSCISNDLLQHSIAVNGHSITFHDFFCKLLNWM